MQNLIAFGVVLLVVIPGAWWVSHTRLVAARNDVENSWADVDNELQRRHVLIPQLIDAVRAIAVHERGLLVDLAARNAAAVDAPHTPEVASELEPPIDDAVATVLALGERYPTLFSQQNFLELQRRLASTEDRIAAARRFYNTRVQHLNRRVEAFPSALVARRHRFDKAEFFGI